MMTLALITPPAEPANDDRDAATSTTVNLLAPRERVRSLVASRLFGDLTTPTRIGHFELIRELGAGGMGVVYAAHDPRLDRAVALKVLARTGDGPDASRRLLREAQAMARLKHPNVVPVYEVGTHGDQVFVAMELVDGGTLAEWMEVGPRPWRQVLEILLPAGRGLAAAHAAGLVHRDFKPANVLLDTEGRARVTDFGLARGGAEPSPHAPLDQAQTTDDIGRALVDTPLTRTGALLGTPAYMAPEQFRGEMATARSDIFAFCVVLWEAIYGRRPFLGHTITELIAAIELGTITAPPRGVHAPAWLRRLLTRGLSSRPGERFASMNELLAALERGERTSVGRTVAVAAGATMATVATAVTAAHLP
ncbi:MAG TPA: serine/threonine-protein kinase, partial [Nannocystaceae bacterium]|nr:serine/threonine-protein kinase [Nannocystaceae bacterium]